jgi:hypothetical protein
MVVVLPVSAEVVAVQPASNAAIAIAATTREPRRRRS